MIRRFLCRIGWHEPITVVKFIRDRYQHVLICRYCRKYIEERTMGRLKPCGILILLGLVTAITFQIIHLFTDTDTTVIIIGLNTALFLYACGFIWMTIGNREE